MFPENDYRDYLIHWGKESGSHKYIDKYKSKNGNWVYIYNKVAGAVGDAGRNIKRQYDLATSRRDIRKRMADGKTGAELKRLREDGRVSWKGAEYSNFGKENEYSKSRRISTKVKKKLNKVKSSLTSNIAKKYPDLDVAGQRARHGASRASKTISRALRKVGNKITLRKARKSLRSISRDRSKVNGAPKLYNRMMSDGRITPQNRWAYKGMRDRGPMTRR